MKAVLVLAALIAVALAKPLDDSATAVVEQFDSENNGNDGYKFA
jgi:hypothetical protein